MKKRKGKPYRSKTLIDEPSSSSLKHDEEAHILPDYNGQDADEQQYVVDDDLNEWLKEESEIQDNFPDYQTIDFDSKDFVY